MIRTLAASIALALLVSGCGIACACSTPVVPVTVFGAASLKTALEHVRDAYAPPGPKVVITISTGSSAALRAQIEQGADADLFLSADTTNPQALVDAGLTDGPAESFASNLLTIVVPDGNPGNIASPADLAREGVRIIAAGEDVPITKYAVQAVDKLAALPGYPAAFAAAYEANIVSREENVGAVTSKLDLGEGDAAIVYVTDATSAGLQTVEIAGDANVVATYSGVVLRVGTSNAAHALLEWIRGADGQRILTDLGFLPAQ